jgi:hypothetical protein
MLGKLSSVSTLVQTLRDKKVRLHHNLTDDRLRITLWQSLLKERLKDGE